MLIRAFTSKLTFHKIINYCKVYLSFIISKLTNKIIVWGVPYSMSIEISSKCNLKCPQCPKGKEALDRNSNIKLKLYDNIINSNYKYLLNIFLYFQGEPFLHPDLFEMINKANEKNIFSVISTNGHFLTTQNCKKLIKSGLDKIIISLDGANNNVYQKYRNGGNFDKVIEGIEELVKTKMYVKSKKPYIVIQFLVFKFNEHQLIEMKGLAKKLKVDKLQFKKAQIYNFENDTEYIPENLKYSRYKHNNEGKYYLPKRNNNFCFRLWNSTVIIESGKVLPCCFDKEAQFVLGNINNNELMEIWNNDKYRKFRKTVSLNNKKLEICKNCTNNLKRIYF